MNTRLNLLFLPHPRGAAMFIPWVDDVFAAIGDRHYLRLLDFDQPIAPQFADVDVVIDHGGEHGHRTMANAADLATNRVKLWQVLGTGVDHFDLELWRSLAIPVANCPGQYSAVALGECALLFILLLARQYPATQANLQRGEMYTPLGRELTGLKLGIVGFGASGQELARRARAFAMEIAAIDLRDITAAEVREFGLAFAGKPADLDRVIAESDVISLHLHLDASTRQIIDKRCLALMKPTAWLINVARGALVDEAALREAMLAGRIGGAGLDVFSQEPPNPADPLFSLPNVIATPHIAGTTFGTSRGRAQCVADNVERIAAGLEPLHRVV
jgi:phosphoglycerate dehydrogenase-like enzyme